jgi:hypothetical protein
MAENSSWASNDFYFLGDQATLEGHQVQRSHEKVGVTSPDVDAIGCPRAMVVVGWGWMLFN